MVCYVAQRSHIMDGMAAASSLLVDDHDHAARIERLGICAVCTAAKVRAEVTVEEAPAEHDLFGELEGQVRQVAEAMGDGRWCTLRGLSGQLGIEPQSVSARIRDLRKPDFGAHVIEKRPTRRGQYEYRLVS